MEPTNARPHVVIVGGGISGLAAAFFLRDEAVRVTVLEGSPRLGGKLSVSEVAGIAVDEGAEARRFGVETSGQTFLYDTHGALTFSGGITGSRGHAGENSSELSLVALLSNRQPQKRDTSVFGCPLFATAD